FDKNGKIAIPAIYNEALPFRNNMAVALKNAERVCWNGEKYSDQNKCEHWSWKGGETYLINDKNEILIEKFNYNKNLDWFSLIITDEQKYAQNRELFKGTNDKYYSFINFEKEFKNWFARDFLLSTDLSSLENNCSTEVAFWSYKKSDWIKNKTDRFLAKNKEILIQQINDFRLGNMEYSVRQDSLNPYIFDNDKYSEYFDSCGNAKKWQNPVFTALVSHRNEKGILELDYKNYFEFLKTNQGYKLISLGLKDKGLK
ncbi:MAG: WG repeat-containing protein, partial [Desulfobacteraceae bacterium]|nr:WG repeat-containing protein [Desulfobacteraceae bacterium]